MLAYTGQTRDRRLIDLMVQSDVGVVVMAEEIARSMLAPIRRKRGRTDIASPEPALRRLAKLLGNWPRWFMDNGAFGAFKAGTRFDVPSWTIAVVVCEWLRRNGPPAWLPAESALPDFIVLPDIVGGGLQSLEFSMAALKTVLLDGVSPDLGFALVVQEGMRPEDLPWDEPWDTLFIGGADLGWKMGTAPQWTAAARANGRFVHIGRVGTQGRVLEARRIGVDSIDSSLPLFSMEQAHRFLDALRDPVQHRLFS